MSTQPLATIRQWNLDNIHLAIQQIIRVLPRDEPAIDLKNIARRHGGGNIQRLGSPHRLPDTCPFEYRRGTHKIKTHLATLVNQWECSVRVVEPWRRSARTPCAENDKRGLRSKYRFHVCATAQSQAITRLSREKSKTKRSELKSSEKSSAVSKKHSH